MMVDVGGGINRDEAGGMTLTIFSVIDVLVLLDGNQERSCDWIWHETIERTWVESGVIRNV